MINYSEFLTATITKDLYQLSEQLSESFSKFSKDGGEYITKNSLMNAIGGDDSGYDIDKALWEQVLLDADTDGDGKISF